MPDLKDLHFLSPTAPAYADATVALRFPGRARRTAAEFTQQEGTTPSSNQHTFGVAYTNH